MDGTQGDAATMDPQMVRRDGPAVYRVRHHGHIDHGAGEAGRIGRPGVEGQPEGWPVELSHLLVGDHDPSICDIVGLCGDLVW